MQSVSLRQNEVAKKVIIVAQCLAQMRQLTYKLVLMLNDEGNIIHASCGCPAGSGPNCTCKHVAALCYALEDFNKTFVLPEDIPSCTGILNNGYVVCHILCFIYFDNFTEFDFNKVTRQIMKHFVIILPV